MGGRGGCHKRNLQKNNSRRKSCREWKRVLRGKDGKEDNALMQLEMYYSKRKVGMVRYLNFLVLSMVILHDWKGRGKDSRIHEMSHNADI